MRMLAETSDAVLGDTVRCAFGIATHVIKLKEATMPELIQQYTIQLQGPGGVSYLILTYGQAREDGTWEGWLEFHPQGGIGPVLRTERETSQPNREALAYWASGLERVYFEGALARAS